MEVQDVHARGMAKSTALSGFHMADAIGPLEVIAALNRVQVSFVLVGAYGLAGWTKKARATEDVDIIVASRHHKKAVKALLEAFNHLEADEHHVVTRLRDKVTHDVAIDVMRPSQQLFREAFKHTHTVNVPGQSYRIPSLEMALAMKFAPMISLHRQDEDKHLDAHDFIAMVKANPKIDLERLAELGELVYPGGGKEIVDKVDQVRRGEALKL